jgi:MmeI, DNA-methyltransferase domain/MmeI, N-terminal domain/MmeI, helicase spacer domain/MmeI, target recognition domain
MPDGTKLAEFVAWCQKNVTGDEKGQAQIFLDRLFQAFGQPGCLDVGGTTEFRIRKADEDGGGTAFADYVWKPVVLIEMKKRGENLQKHYRQAFDYWTRLVPNRPRYVVLCNFDEFRVYDFDTDLDTPKDTLALKDLPERWGPLTFLAPGSPRPTFDNDREKVTRQAADCLAECFRKLIKRGVPRETAQRFILQMLVALFAEDIDLLPKYFVTQILEDCSTPASAYDLIGGLFEAMNTNPPLAGGRFKGVSYFNGGLFHEPARLELQGLELVLLRKAAAFDWSKVQPEVFGTLFQHSMDDDERRAFGAHFTSPSDIMKIVGPTIVEPWRAQVEQAKTLKELYQLTDRLHHFRVLDPACGSGNFLYIAYRELKRIEARIFERMEKEFKTEAKQSGQMRLSFLSAQNFYGLDILPFAVEIAKVTMMIARKLAIDELHITEKALPLDNLDQNFIATDALLTPEGLPAQWPKADVIIGNPPFLGAKLLKPERGPDYVNTLRRAYAEVPGMADYCVYWIRKAHDHLPACTSADPVAGRAGLVGTQNIRNNQSRVGGLDYVVKTGTIVEAVENQPWSGEANVHVSIANWVKSLDAALLPKTRKLWFKVEPSAAAKKLRKRGSNTSKEYELDVRECDQINSTLSDEIDVSGAKTLDCNANPQRVFRGQEPGSRGFVVNQKQKHQIENKDSKSSEVIFPHLVGRDLLTGNGMPTRWVIDFGDSDQLTAASHSAAFEHVKNTVLVKMEKIAAGEIPREERERFMDQFLRARLGNWWQFRRACVDTISAITKLSRYIVCSRHTKRPVFEFMSSRIRPDSAVQVFAFEDDYSFGILQGFPHTLWFITKCGKLTERLRYSPESVFDTFPWPQTATVKQIDTVAAAARELRRVRAEALPKLKGGLRALYRNLELPGANPLKDAHAALDAAVLTAYGFNPEKDLLAQLLALNQKVAARIEKGESVIAPGVPKNYPDAKKLVTNDCIKP